MAESYSVEAILSAIDKGFTSTMKSAERSIQGIGSGAKSSLGSIMNIASGVGVFKALDAAVSSVTSHLGDAVDRYDTLNQFPKVMKQMGYSTEESNKAMEKLSSGIEKVPTSLDTVVSTSKRIALLTGNLGKATDTTLALNNAMIASGSSSADAERGMEQYIQMLSKGSVDMQSWRTLQETMSYALGETAKKLGIASGNSNELYDSLQSGKITFDEFNKALIECNEGTGGFAEVAVTASGGIKTAMSNMGIYITRGLANAMKATDKMLQNNGFGKIEDIINKSSQNIITASDAICTAIENMGGLNSTLLGFGTALAAVFSAGAMAGLPEMTTAISGFGKRLGNPLKKASASLKQFGNSANSIGWGVVDKLSQMPKIGDGVLTGAVRASDGIKSMKTAMTGATGAVNKFVGNIPVIGPLLEKIPSAAGKMANGTTKYFTMLAKVATSAFMPAVMVGAVLVGLGALYKAFGTQIDSIIAMVTTKGPMIITNLANSVVSQIPILLQVGANIMLGIMNAITANLPALLTAGVDIITSLVNGVATNLPMLIPAGVEMVMTLLQGLANNSGKLISAGLNLLKGLAQGIANAMPIVARKAPEVIAKLAVSFVQNLPKIIKTGMDIIVKLAQGLAQAVPQLIAKIPSIIQRMKTAFTSQNWGEVGRHIVSGIVSGLAGAAGSLLSAMAGLAKRAVEAAKSHLKIGSPSRVFKREVGKWIPIGMAKGVIAHTSAAVKATRQMAGKVFAASGVDLLNNSGGLYGRYAVATGYTSTSEVFANQNATYQFNISSEMDGREVAHGTAKYTKKELEKMQTREERKNGKR